MTLAALALATTLGAPSPGAPYEVVVDQAVFQHLLDTVAPIERTVKPRGGVLGAITVNVVLTEPKVRVTSRGIEVRFKYTARDSAGAVSLQGSLDGEMQIVKVKNKNMFQARLSRGAISLPGGIKLPMEQFVEPIRLPHIIKQPLRLGKANVQARAEGEEVVFKKGKVILKGRIFFERM